MKINLEADRSVLKTRPPAWFGEPYPLNEFRFDEMMGDFFCPAAYYYCIVDFRSKKCEWVSQHVEHIFGIQPVNFSLEALVERYCPEDIDFVNQCEQMVADFLINKIRPDQMLRYKINYCVRIKTKFHGIKLFLHQALVLSIGKNDEPSKILYIHSDISHLGVHNNYKISFIGLHGNPSFFEMGVLKANEQDVLGRHPVFTQREQEVMGLLVQGYTAPEIADLLFISTETVKSHRKNMLAKARLRNTTELVAFCIKQGYV